MSYTGGPDTDYTWLSPSCGLMVSKICYGTTTFADQEESTHNPPGQTNEEQSHALLDRFVELGGNFIDTANVYSMGYAERFLGSWLAKQPERDRFVIATKVRADMGYEFGGSKTRFPNRVGLSRNSIIQNVEDSLKRLQTHYIDLLQFHSFDYGVPLDETLRTADDLVRSGKVRYIGGCNLTGWQLQKMVDLIDKMGLSSKCVTLQQNYNLLARDSEYEPIQVCKNEGIGLIPWGPMKGGLLSGKFKRNQVIDPLGSRVGWSTALGNLRYSQAAPDFSCYEHDKQFWNIMDTLEDIAKTKGKKVSQVALCWVLQRHPVTALVSGARTIEQLESNMEAVSKSWSLCEEEMDRLTTASTVPMPYPYDWDDMHNSERFRCMGATM